MERARHSPAMSCQIRDGWKFLITTGIGAMVEGDLQRHFGTW